MPRRKHVGKTASQIRRERQLQDNAAGICRACARPVSKPGDCRCARCLGIDRANAKARYALKRLACDLRSLEHRAKRPANPENL